MCDSGWLGTGFDLDTYVITVMLLKLIELGDSDRSFDVCIDVNIEGLLAGFGDCISAGVRRFVSYNWLHGWMEI